MTEKKPRTRALSPLWDWEVFEREMRRVIEQEFVDEGGTLIKTAGAFPSREALVKIRRTDLVRAIYRWHGGFTEISLRFGIAPARRPVGYWRDFERVRQRLSPIVDREIRDDAGAIVKRRGEMPTAAVLIALGESSLSTAMQLHHGGLVAVAKRLGCQRPGKWDDVASVLREATAVVHRELVDERGNAVKPSGVFPTRAQLLKTGHGDLMNAIQRYGGIGKIRHLLGMEDLSQSIGDFKDFELVRQRLSPIIGREIRDETGTIVKRRGEMPTGRMLAMIGERPLLKGIYRFHGGLREVRRRLGFPATTAPPGHWKDFARVQEMLLAIVEREYVDREGNVIKRAGEFPTSIVLKAIGSGGLLGALQSLHGGIEAARSSMGFGGRTVKRGHWNDFSNVERELRAIIDMEYRDQSGALVKAAGQFPTGKHLKAMGRSALMFAVQVHHGGLRTARRRLGFPVCRVERGYWLDEENVMRELRRIIDQEIRDSEGRIINPAGELPSQTFLKARGMSSLCRAITRFGGAHAVSRALGCATKAPRPSPWRDFAAVEQALREIMAEEYRGPKGSLIRAAGVFPGPTELRSRGLGGLVSSWSYLHGGRAAVRARMAIPATGGRREYWADLANVERELRMIIESDAPDEFGTVIKPAGRFPTYGELRLMGRHDILQAMQAFHGGYLRVRERMGYSAAVPDAVADEFLRKLKTIEGAEELIRCPDLGIADKADVLVARHREVFSSTEYVDWVLRSLLDLPSFAPYVEAGRAVRGAYRTGWGLDVLAERHPGLFESRDLFALLVRKLENLFFRQLQAEPQAAMERLEAGIRDHGVLKEVYAAVGRSLNEIHSLVVPGVVGWIRNPHWLPGSDLPETIPFPSLHQKRGVLRIMEQRRVLIADEMGTGKTAQAILASRLLQARLGRRIRTLVVCPNSVMAWWRDKIHEYCEGTNSEDVVMVSGRGHVEHDMHRVAEGVDFALINYHLLAKRHGAAYPALVGELAGMGFDFVVADEVHNAKNMNANRAEALQRVTERVPYVALLSGTPIPNRLRDIGMTMSLLEPVTYPTARHFTKAYGNNPRLIRDALINGRMLRVRSEDVFDLPQLTMREVTVGLVPAQRDAYIAIYRDGSIDAYTKMWLLRLLLVDPNAVIREPRRDALPSPKYDALDRIVQETTAGGRKVVVFTSIKRGVTRELVMRYARFGVCLIDGDVDAFPRKKKESQRETIRRKFQFGDAGVLIATLGTMSEGVDLSAASTVVFLDKPFTSTARDQAIKRVHRLGQTKPVEVISIVARDPAIDAVIRDKDTGDHGTIDEAIERLIDKKELLIQHVVDGARLSPEERRLLEERENLGRVLYSLA